MAPRYGEWRPLGPQTQPRMGAHDIFCLHTMVGSLLGTDAYFKQNGYGGTESHWGVGDTGRVFQWQDITHTADANLDGKYRVLSVETSDYGESFGSWNTSDASQVPPWTDAQCEALAALMEWACRKSTHAECPPSFLCHQQGIPLEAIPDTKPGRRGIGWHRQGVDSSPLYQHGYRVLGGERWSTATGKVCPGSRRIAQIPGIIARARVLASPAPVAPPVQEDDDMPKPYLMNDGGAQYVVAVDLSSKTKILNPDILATLSETDQYITGVYLPPEQMARIPDAVRVQQVDEVNDGLPA